MDCSKELCPPPCALVKKCDEIDTKVDYSQEARSWIDVACIPAPVRSLETFTGSEVDDDFFFDGFLPDGFIMPVKSYKSIYSDEMVPEWSGDRAVKNYPLVDSLDACFRSPECFIQPWMLTTRIGLYPELQQISAEDTVFQTDIETGLKAIDFCKNVFNNLPTDSASLDYWY